jgi:cytochrome c oxidase cbb3-type subunit 1
MYVLRGLGGVLYLSGAVFMVINVWKTIAGSPLRAEAPLYNIDQNKANDVPLVARACRIRGTDHGF